MDSAPPSTTIGPPRALILSPINLPDSPSCFSNPLAKPCPLRISAVFIVPLPILVLLKLSNNPGIFSDKIPNF